jgi:hypothetical protein
MRRQLVLSGDFPVFSDADTEFHTPENVPWDWAETNYFAFTIPEERLWGQVYVLTRAGIGAMLVEVVVGGALSIDRGNVLYLDSQCHLPIVSSLSNLETVNGLKIRAKSIRDYYVSYAGYGGMSLSFTFTALMAPFDLNDPEMNPLAGAKDGSGGGHDSTGGAGAAYANHFDMTGSVKGELKLNGRDYPINCVETMDHSWGRRHVYGNEVRPMYWFHAHFGEELAIHWIGHWDVSQDNGQDHSLASGYVVRKGQVEGLVDVKMRVIRVDHRVATSMDVEATDKNGKFYRMYGIVEAGAPSIQGYNAMDMRNYLVKWILGDGTVGYGLSIEGAQMACLAPRTGMRWTGRADCAATATTLTW